MDVQHHVGRLERVDLREIWGDEARHFTPWLATESALDLLREVIGYQLELIETEVAVGPFSADIFAKVVGEEDHKVVIENQLGKTDHDHLGKMITYAAGLGAKTLVWVSDRFCEEHRAALDWLNENSGERVSFIGLEIRAFKIGDSLPAPHFTVISRPNITTRAAREQISSTERKTHDELMLMAEANGTTSLAEKLMKLQAPLGISPEPSKAYGGSIRCFRRTSEGRPRVVLGLNISGERKQAPRGQLDVWFPLQAIADVTASTIDAVQQALGQMPVLLRETTD